MDFNIVKGNIVDAQVDAIVLPANAAMKEGSGASTAIFEAAGRRQLTKACERIGKCEVGLAVPTKAFKLNSKYIIHAVVPRWIDGNHNEYELLSSAYASSLELADALDECDSIAFPLLASGNNGFDLEFAFDIAVESITRFNSKTLKSVTVVAYGKRIADIIKEKGYEATVLPRSMDVEDIDNRLVKLAKNVKGVAVDVAFNVAESQIIEGMRFFEKPENRKKVFEFGKEVVQLVGRNRK